MSQVENVNIKGRGWEKFESLSSSFKGISNKQGHVEDFKLLGKDLLRNFSFEVGVLVE